MFSRLFRQRRRITGLALSGLWSGTLVLDTLPAAFGCAAIAFLVACCISVLVPQHRRWTEALAVGLLFAATLAWSGIDENPAILVHAGLAVAALIHILLQDPRIDISALQLGLTSRKVTRIKASPARIWAALIPGEGHPDDYWTGNLADFDRDPDDPMTVYQRFRGRDGFHQDVTVTFLELEPLKGCRYIIERFADHTVQIGTMQIQIAPIANGESLITGCLHYAALPPRIALERWLDDTFGDEWDSFAAMVSARRDWSVHGLQFNHPGPAKPMEIKAVLHHLWPAVR